MNPLRFLVTFKVPEVVTTMTYLDVYVAPTNGQADFRLKSRSVKRIATGVSIFSTPGNHTFNVPIGVTRVLALTVAGGSNFDYIHKPSQPIGLNLKKIFNSHPFQVKSR